MRILACAWLVAAVPFIAAGETVSSRNGQWTATVIRGEQGSGKRPGTALWSVRVAHERQGVRYTLEKEVPYGSPFPGIQVCDDGGAIIVDAFAGFVEFIDPSGALARPWHPFGEAGPDHERILKCSAAGGRAAFLVSETGGDEARVHVTTARGQALWDAPLVHPMGSEIVLAPDGGIVVASDYRSLPALEVATEIFDGSGRRVRVTNLLMRHAAIDPVDGFVAIADRDEVVIFDQGEEVAAGRWMVTEEGVCITGLAIVGGQVGVLAERVVAGSAGVRYERPALIRMDRTGRVLGRTVGEGVAVRPRSVSGTGGVFVVTGEDGQITLPPTR